jgi:hypothetical protein
MRALLLCVVATTAAAAPFSAGGIVVLQLGDGVNTVSSVHQAVKLVEIS